MMLPDATMFATPLHVRLPPDGFAADYAAAATAAFLPA